MTEETRRKIDTHAKALMQRLEDEKSKAHADSLLLMIIAEAIRVLRIRDGLNVSDEQCVERARNAAQAIIIQFDVHRRKP